VSEEVGCRRQTQLEDYPLAKYCRWRRPRDQREGALSLSAHLERDAPSSPMKGVKRELTDFQKERRLFHRLRAEKVERGEGEINNANGATRSGQAQNGRTFGGDSRV